MKTKREIATLLIAAAIGSAPAAGCAQTQAADQPTPVAGEEALERQIADLQPAVCGGDPALCSELKAFADSAAPCFPQGEGLTVGHAYLIEDDGRVRAAEYFALQVQRAGEVTLVQTQHVSSENDEEKRAAEALVADIGNGALDQANALYRYLVGSGRQAPELLAQPEGRSLVVRAEGPLLYLRQAGKHVYAVLPDAVVTQAGAPQRRIGLLFAVLPALAQCK